MPEVCHTIGMHAQPINSRSTLGSSGVSQSQASTHSPQPPLRPHPGQGSSGHAHMQTVRGMQAQPTRTHAASCRHAGPAHTHTSSQSEACRPTPHAHMQSVGGMQAHPTRTHAVSRRHAGPPHTHTCSQSEACRPTPHALLGLIHLKDAGVIGDGTVDGWVGGWVDFCVVPYTCLIN